MFILYLKLILYMVLMLVILKKDVENLNMEKIQKNGVKGI